MKFFLLSLIVLQFPSAFAGQDKGGGDAVVCGKDVFLADIASSKSYSHLVYKVPEEGMRKAILNVVDSNNPGLGKELREIISSFNIQFEQEVKELNDDGIRLSFWKNIFCDKRQLAVQDFETNTVTISKPLYDRLTIVEKSLLLIHEAFILKYRAESEQNGNTAEVRKRIKAIYDSKGFARAVLVELAEKKLISKSPERIKEASCSGITQLYDANVVVYYALAGVLGEKYAEKAMKNPNKALKMPGSYDEGTSDIMLSVAITNRLKDMGCERNLKRAIQWRTDRNAYHGYDGFGGDYYSIMNMSQRVFNAAVEI